MKNSVMSAAAVVAATMIAANGVAAEAVSLENGAAATENQTWDGQTGMLFEPMCNFTRIEDGEMTYIPPFAHVGVMTPGHWRTTKTAVVEVSSLNAKSLIVEGENTLYLNEAATDHDILVDYFPDPTGHNYLEAGYTTADENAYADPNNDTGVTNPTFSADHAGITFQTKTYLSNNYSNVNWEFQGTVVGGNVNIPGAHNAGNRWEAHNIEGWGTTASESQRIPGTPYKHTIAIGGAAYMLDNADQPLYSLEAALEDGSYGMADGNYHIKHKVTCLQ